MSKYCFGVDLGGTTVKIGLFDPEGTVIEKWEIPTIKTDSGSRIRPHLYHSLPQKRWANSQVSRFWQERFVR